MSAAKTAVSKPSPRNITPSIDQVPQKPLTPRRGLLLLCVVVFSLWVAAMIVMYFKTVYPHRHGSATPAAETSESLPH